MNDSTLNLDPADLRPLHGVRPEKHRATDLQATLDELAAGTLPLPIVRESINAAGTYEAVTLDRVRAAAIRAKQSIISVRLRNDLSHNHLRCVEVHYTDLIADPYVRPIERIRCILDLLAYVLLWDSEVPDVTADPRERPRVATQALHSHRTHRRGRATPVSRMLGLEPAAIAELVEEVVATRAQMTPVAFAAHRLPLLDAPDVVKAALTSGEISLAQAEQLARLSTEAAAEALRDTRVPSSRAIAARARGGAPRQDGRPVASRHDLGGREADPVVAAEFLLSLPRLTANESRKLQRIIREILDLRSRYTR